MIARVWTTAEMKETARGLRDAGYEVLRKLNGWNVTIKGTHENHEVLKSMYMGNNRYLVRYDERLFQGGE
jgi:hypothetical protein